MTNALAASVAVAPALNTRRAMPSDVELAAPAGAASGAPLPPAWAGALSAAPRAGSSLVAAAAGAVDTGEGLTAAATPLLELTAALAVARANLLAFSTRGGSDPSSYRRLSG